MVQTLKIGMIGGMDSGKTCFMLSMYAAMRLGTRGFTFSAENPDVDLDFEHAWDDLLDGEGQRRWPQATTFSSTYAFSLNYGFRPLLRFEWIDYRGGALRERQSDSESATELRELRRYFSSCGSIIAVLAATELKDPDRGSAKLDREVGRLNTLFQEVAVAAEKAGSPLPSVTIIITKADLLAAWASQRGGLGDKMSIEELLEKRIRELFGPLFITGRTGWTVMICPVTLGLELAEGVDTGEIEPQNVHLPVTFAVDQWFRRCLGELHTEQDALRTERLKLAGGTIKNWWNSEELQTVGSALDRTEAEMQQVTESIDLLRTELLRQASIYVNGVKQKD